VAERRPLRIGIDYRPAVMDQPAGIGRAVRAFVEALGAIDHPHDVRLYVDRPLPAPVARARERLGPRTGSAPRALAWHLWSALDAWRSGLDVYVATSSLFMPMLMPRRCVVFVWDLSALRVGWTHTWKVRALHWIGLGRAIRRAARIVVNAEFTRRDLLAYAPSLDTSRVVVLPLGLDRAFEHPVSAEARAGVRERLRLPERYILAVNTLEPRKNIGGLLRAYARLRARGPTDHALVIVGKRGWLLEGIEAEARAMGVAEHVVFTGFVANEDLPAVFAGADAFVMPSFFEGFGLPLLEAMSTGAPIVTSPISSMPEIAGDAALYADPASPDDIADKVARVLGDPAEADRLRAAGRARVRAFSWGAFAQGVLSAIEAAAPARLRP